MCLADNSQEMLGFFLLFFCLFVFLLLSFSFFFKKIRLDISSELSAENKTMSSATILNGTLRFKTD